MKRGARGHPIGIRDKLRNDRISRKRTKGERPFAVIKSVFTSGTVRVTEMGRVRVKKMFSAFSYNLDQLRTVFSLIKSNDLCVFIQQRVKLPFVTNSNQITYETLFWALDKSQLG